MLSGAGGAASAPNITGATTAPTRVPAQGLSKAGAIKAAMQSKMHPGGPGAGVLVPNSNDSSSTLSDQQAQAVAVDEMWPGDDDEELLSDVDSQLSSRTGSGGGIVTEDEVDDEIDDGEDGENDAATRPATATTSCTTGSNSKKGEDNDTITTKDSKESNEDVKKVVWDNTVVRTIVSADKNGKVWSPGVEALSVIKAHYYYIFS